jgi:hypothetical protein
MTREDLAGKPIFEFDLLDEFITAHTITISLDNYKHYSNSVKI